jgi:hypothetical protein
LNETSACVIFADNCTAHPKIDNLQAVKLLLFPQIITSVMQPMDQGIIDSVRVQYRKKFNFAKIQEVDRDREFQVYLKMSINWLFKA